MHISKGFFAKLTLISATAILGVFFVSTLVNKAEAQSPSLGSVVGIIDSANIGYIYLSSNTPGAPNIQGWNQNNSVKVDSTTHNFSGYAWSDNIGWVSFNANETISCGPQAQLGTTGATGFAKALAGSPTPGAGGWSGCLSLKGSDGGTTGNIGYYVHYDGTNLSDYSWGSPGSVCPPNNYDCYVIGWAKWSATVTLTPPSIQFSVGAPGASSTLGSTYTLPAQNSPVQFKVVPQGFSSGNASTSTNGNSNWPSAVVSCTATTTFDPYSQLISVTQPTDFTVKCGTGSSTTVATVTILPPATVMNFTITSTSANATSSNNQTNLTVPSGFHETATLNWTLSGFAPGACGITGGQGTPGGLNPLPPYQDNQPYNATMDFTNLPVIANQTYTLDCGNNMSAQVFITKQPPQCAVIPTSLQANIFPAGGTAYITNVTSIPAGTSYHVNFRIIGNGQGTAILGTMDPVAGLSNTISGGTLTIGSISSYGTINITNNTSTAINTPVSIPVNGLPSPGYGVNSCTPGHVMIVPPGYAIPTTGKRPPWEEF